MACELGPRPPGVPTKKLWVQMGGEWLDVVGLVGEGVAHAAAVARREQPREPRLHRRVAHRLKVHVRRQERRRCGVADHDEGDARVEGHRLQGERQPRRQLTEEDREHRELPPRQQRRHGDTLHMWRRLGAVLALASKLFIRGNQRPKSTNCRGRHFKRTTDFRGCMLPHSRRPSRELSEWRSGGDQVEIRWRCQSGVRWQPRRPGPSHVHGRRQSSTAGDVVG